MSRTELSAPASTVSDSGEPAPDRWATLKPHAKRLVTCLFGGFAMALMIGKQEGAQKDLGIAFAQATETGRLLVFLGIGLVFFVLVTFWSRIAPYLRHPGASTVVVGLILAVVGTGLLNWYDPIGKFSAVASLVGSSSNPPFTVGLFFGTFGWLLLAIPLVVGGIGVATRWAWVGYLQVAVSVLAAVLVVLAHTDLVSYAAGGKYAGNDHSLGVWFAFFGYLVYALAGVVVVVAKAQTAEPLRSIERAMNWRPGLPLALAAVVFAIFSYLNAAWFAPIQQNWDFAATRSNFAGHGLPGYVSSYLDWLGMVLFAVSVVVAILGCLRRSRALSLAGAALGLIGLVYTFVSIYKITKLGADLAPQYGRRWLNLGAGGWLACFAFTFVLGAGLLASLRKRLGTGGAMPNLSAPGLHGATRSGITRTAIVVAVAVALFYPPTLPTNWQSLIVSQIAAYLLLAVGLNVVVGWAGLLDLGYVAFYGIGSYTTAYFTGSLPIKPPSWLHFSPLEAIPFAIIACLIAGVLLGAPTLRLRGDYLAIVTLGFGEIIEVAANNNPGGLTGGPTGPTVPHPSLHLGPLHLTWGLDNLPYWYLLLCILVIVIFLFYRLESSRLGRAWAAIREDEVAAQASGVRTVRVKLLAFAIGASTSGIAGVFFASSVGYFDPTNFTLQISILIVAYLVFGGMGSMAGALAGAAVLTWLPYFLQSQVPLQDAQMWIGAIVLFMMIFRPAGLIPARRRQAELHGLDSPASSEVSAVPMSEGL